MSDYISARLNVLYQLSEFFVWISELPIYQERTKFSTNTYGKEKERKNETNSDIAHLKT